MMAHWLAGERRRRLRAASVRGALAPAACGSCRRRRVLAGAGRSGVDVSLQRERAAGSGGARALPLLGFLGGASLAPALCVCRLWGTRLVSRLGPAFSTSLWALDAVTKCAYRDPVCASAAERSRCAPVPLLSPSPAQSTRCSRCFGMAVLSCEAHRGAPYRWHPRRADSVTGCAGLHWAPCELERPPLWGWATFEA